MLNERGLPIRPPEGDELETTLARVRAKIADRVGSRRSKRDKWLRTGGAAALSIVLFGGGVAVGGAALAPLMQPGPAFTVACYPTQEATTMTAQLSYTSESDAVGARHDPVGACGQSQSLGTLENGVDAIVQQQIAAGHQCGTLHLTDGSTWSYVNDPKDGLSVESAVPTTPLGRNCVVLNDLTIDRPTPTPAFACTVDAQHVNVYPGDHKDASSVCSAKGLTVAAK